MKKLLTLFSLIFISTFAKANSVEDSLIANIGKKAKVIFYAQNKADFNEIAKYDLNKLFAEVRKRSEKNFSNNEEVTLREVDENLKNRTANTTVSSKNWLKNMNLNLFVGANFANGSLSTLTSIKEVIVPQYGRSLEQFNWLSLAAKPSFMLGIGGFFDKPLYKKNKFDFSLRYGFGIDILSSRFKTSNDLLINYWDSKIPINKISNVLDSLKNLQNYKDSPFKSYISPNLYIQVIPTLNLINNKGEKTFSLGIGLKAAVNMAGITIRNRLEYISYSNPDVNLAYPKYNTLQTAFVANVGYKFVNLFIQMQPDIGAAVILQSKDGLRNNRSQGTFSNYAIGLRFGK